MPRSSPLAGITVVDLTRLLPGPLASKILRDLGARVIKVEEPSVGDPVRYAPPRPEGASSLGGLLLAGVESVALDLKTDDGREVLERLLGRADVLLDTFRPGTLERLLGVGPTELVERHPRLVVCSISGWGANGPHAGRAGHDLTYQALAGTLAPTEDLAAAPAVPLADVAGAWSAATAILAKLVARERSGRGGVIDASLYDAAVHANLAGWAAEAGGPRRAGEALPLTGELPCYRLYPTADGAHVALAPLEARFWRRFCKAADRKDLAARHLDDSEATRRAVAELVASRTAEQWQQLFEEHDLPAEVVLSAARAREHPQQRARGVLRGTPQAPRLAFPAVLDGERPAGRDAVPELGEDTEAILDEVGLEPEGWLQRLGRQLTGRGGVGRRFSLKRLLAEWRG